MMELLMKGYQFYNKITLIVNFKLANDKVYSEKIRYICFRYWY